MSGDKYKHTQIMLISFML